MASTIRKLKTNLRIGKAIIIMNKTVNELMSFKRLITMLVIGLAPAILFGAGIWRESFRSGALSLEMQIWTMVGYFLLISFVWIVGAFIAYVIFIGGLDSISKEEESGTLLLIVSKPISRFQFILGKFLGLLVTTLLFEIIILLGSLFIFWLTLRLDPDTVSALLGIIFWIFLYSIIVVIFFDALTIAMSTLFKNQVLKITLSIVLVGFIFTFGLLLRAQWPSTYEKYHLSYIDPGYHLGNIYVSAVEQAESGRMTPQIQAYMGIINGTYSTGTEGTLLVMFTGASRSFDPDIGAMPPSLERTNYINPIFSMLICLVISAAALGAAKIAIERKEVS
jgi:ABC-type transport system involved in multi-copper enzyme maturation permease subunit